jgi:glycosyltransferase involved in cell wall biosynthesis
MELSLVIPIHNENENILNLYGELKIILKPLKTYEIIFVDDGSRDNSFQILAELAKKDKKIKILKLKSNYGQSIAIRAGLDASIGEKIIILDGDGQHNPKYIPAFFNKLKKYDVVCNVRANSHGLKRLITNFGNLLIRSFFRIKLKDSIGGMKGLTKQVKDNIYLYGDMHRYLPLLALWKGFKIGEQEIVIRKRKKGKSKYTLFKGFRGLIDLITVKFFVSYSTRPSYIFGSLGFLSSGIGSLSLLYLIIRKLIFGIGISNNLPWFLLNILLVLIGFNFIFFGLIGDMVSYNHMSQDNKPNYIIDKKI